MLHNVFFLFFSTDLQPLVESSLLLLSLGDTAAPSRRPDDLAPDFHDGEAQLADGGGDGIEQLYDSISVCLMLLMKLASRSTYARRSKSRLDHSGYNPNPPGKVLARIFTGLRINIYSS